MILDKEQEFCDNQALTANTVSNNVLDYSVDRNIGKGEPMAVVVSIANDAVATDETYQFVIQTCADEDFSSSPVYGIMSSEAFPGALLTGGKLAVVPMPLNNLQYVRVSFLLTGTAPAVTVSSYMQPMSMIDGWDVYESGFTII